MRVGLLHFEPDQRRGHLACSGGGAGRRRLEAGAPGRGGCGGHSGPDERGRGVVVGRSVLEWPRLQGRRLPEEARRSRGRCGAQQWRRLGEGGSGLSGGGRRGAAGDVGGRVLHFDLRGGRRQTDQEEEEGKQWRQQHMMK